MAGWFAPTFARRPGTTRWCAQWWLHAEAIVRLEGLWRSWETLRLDPNLGMATWLRDHLDTQRQVLTGDSGPFQACEAGEHNPPPDLPVIPGPGRLLAKPGERGRMNEQHHGDVLGGAIGETTQTAAQLATIAATAAQTAARVHARRFAADHAGDQAAADAERAVLRSEHAAGRLAWAPGLEPPFRTTASGPDAAAVWAAAQPWADHDPSAREAAQRAEQRLAVLYPRLIVEYEQRLADGLDPVDAMADATTALVPIDLNGAEAARALAGDERGEAQQDAVIPDLAATVSVDEHSQGLEAGAVHAGVSDIASARAALLAAQAYPQPLRGALHHAPATGPARPRPVRDVRNSRGR